MLTFRNWILLKPLINSFFGIYRFNSFTNRIWLSWWADARILSDIIMVTAFLEIQFKVVSLIWNGRPIWFLLLRTLFNNLLDRVNRKLRLTDTWTLKGFIWENLWDVLAMLFRYISLTYASILTGAYLAYGLSSPALVSIALVGKTSSVYFEEITFIFLTAHV